MPGFTKLLRENKNYRNLWTGQIVSEIGDNFNTIAVLGLAMSTGGTGGLVSAIFLSRGVAVVSAGPIAGVLLDRMDRRRMMILSDLVRSVVALGFLFCITDHRPVLICLMSFLLMFASPFFTSGRSAILPTIASKDELHAANSLTQTTQWVALSVGTILGGAAIAKFGYLWAFLFNAASFLFSASCISRLHVVAGFRAQVEDVMLRPWHEYSEGLRYIRANRMILGIAMLAVGWAFGGGAAQVLFSLFGELVFHRGAEGVGLIWGCAGIGLLIGGTLAHRFGGNINFARYKRTISIAFLIHGLSYVAFSRMTSLLPALFLIALSRSCVGITNVLNTTQLLRHVDNAFRGRVFSTIESMTWGVMMISMACAGFASTYYDPHQIGTVSGLLSASVAIFWIWADLKEQHA
jgi:predicted MFS family arabinose efflux permease